MDARVAAGLTPSGAFRRGTRDASSVPGVAVAAWGASLVHLALGAGALTAPAGLQPAGVPLIVLGATGLAWGATTLARGRLIAPRASVAGVLSALIAGPIALWADPTRTSVIAVAAASALLITVAFGCGRALRFGTTDAAAPRLAHLVVAAVIVAAVVTPALGATEAGRLAPDHAEHGVAEDHHR